MLFLMPNQQCQSTEDKTELRIMIEYIEQKRIPAVKDYSILPEIAK